MLLNTNLYESLKNTVGTNSEWLYDKYLENRNQMQEMQITAIEDLPIVDKINGYDIIKATAVMYEAGVFIAASVVTVEGNTVILVDDAFELLTESTKAIVIAYELGHLEKHHLEDGEGILSDINKEIEADQYAASLYGYKETAKALEEVMHFYVTLIPEDAVDDVKTVLDIMETRINALLNK